MALSVGEWMTNSAVNKHIQKADADADVEEDADEGDQENEAARDDCTGNGCCGC